MEMVRRFGLVDFGQRLWEWKRPIAMLVAWYMGLVYFRDELELGEFYLLASGFWLVYMVGFSPRQPGELSAYSHFNANHERILGDLDPHRAGRELTGQIFFDNDEDNNVGRSSTLQQDRENDRGHVLGRSAAVVDDEDDADLQRALLISLREEREARRRHKQ